MRLKAVIIVLSALIVAGAGTIVGIYVDREHNKENTSLIAGAVSDAASETLAAEESTTEKEAAQGGSDAPTKKATVSTTVAATKKQFTTDKKITTTKKKVTTTQMKKTKTTSTTSGIPEKPKDGYFEAISSSDGYYWETDKTRENMDERIYVDQRGHHFYFKDGDTSTKRIYLD